MKNTKIYRLALGLIILFSIFFFQGSEQHGCTQCEEESLGGTLTVINNSGFNISVLLIPDVTVGTLMPPKGSKVFYLDEGLYNVIAIQISGFDLVKVLSVHMIEINLGSKKTLEIK